MTLRSIKLPEDLLPMAEMSGPAWQYPDHPEWSIQAEEEQAVDDSMKNYSRIWPLIRLIQFFSPQLRDFLHGYVWEEAGKIVGFTNASRQGATPTWMISAVAVLPEYRRRGIARQLVSATLEEIRARGGQKVLLDMIAGNLPALNLYRSMGFEAYTGSLEYLTAHQGSYPEPALPQEYAQEPSDFFDWQPRFELESRITPAEITRYEAVDETRFRRPLAARLLWPLMQKADGVQVEGFVVRDTASRQIVAHARSETRANQTGHSGIHVRLDPAHSSLATYLVGYLLHRVTRSAPDRKVEFSAPLWQAALIEAATQASMQKRLEFIRLGLVL